MKNEKLYDGITDIREEIIEKAERYEFQKELPKGLQKESEKSEGVKEDRKSSERQNRNVWVKWGTLAACLLLVVGGALSVAAKNGKLFGTAKQEESAGGKITLTEDGVTIPKREVTLGEASGEAYSMISCFVYEDRCYIYYDHVKDALELIGEYVGTSNGLINEWTEKDGYVNFAGTIKGDFYTVKGYDPSFMLCMRDEVAGADIVTLYICDSGFTLKYGADLYEDRLHLSENYEAVRFESRDSWFYSKGEVYQFNEKNDTVAAFLEQLDTAKFIPWEMAVEQEGKTANSMIDEMEIYHMFFDMKDKTTVHLRLYENGYVRFQGLWDVCVQVPEESYDALIALFDSREGAKPVLEQK